MKKILAVLLAATMVVTTVGFVSAEEASAEYTQQKVFDGTYGFGDAEITVKTNDDMSAFDMTFICFDEENELSGTITNGICMVSYDKTGFVAGDCQQIWDDACANENAWEPIDGAAAEEAAEEAPVEETAEEATAEETEEAAAEGAALDIADYFWELSDDMSDEDFLKYALRNFKFVQSVEPIVDADSYFNLYAAITHLKQKADGAREEFLAAQEGLILEGSIADRVYFLWDADNMPCLDGESFTEEELDEGVLDSYGFIPLLIKCLIDDPTQAKGNIVVVSGGGMTNRSNSGEAYPAIEVFNNLGYNVFVLQRRIRPYSDEDIFMDMQRAIRVVRYYAAQEGWGGQDMIAGCGWSGGAATVMGAVNYLYGDLNATRYCSTYVPDEIDEVSSDMDVAMPIYGGHFADEIENPNIPAIYTCAGSEDTTGAADAVQEIVAQATEMGIPAQVRIFEGAGHGFGVGQEGALKGTEECAEWPAEADAFMQANLGYSTKDKE